MTRIDLSRIHFPVTNLGHGTRIGVWVQGCTVHCRGCISRDTWPARPDDAVAVDAVLDRIAADLPSAHGVTVSGGEPTDQPAALHELLAGIDRLRGRRDDLDVLVYTGRSLAEAVELVPGLAGLADAVISEPFLADRVDATLALRGSSNQVVTPMTALGRRRYGRVDADLAHQRDTIGLHVDDDSIWMVGIPRPGDLVELETALAADGITLGRRSWLT